jgi:hypothetical protein
LDGIDTAGRVGVDSVFLGRVNPRDGAPAIQHGYAATIYQAQGATLDSAFVMADPSMTKEEFYVAGSRTRAETFIYATPEVQLAREEIAPDSPYLRHGLEHIAEAAERVGAQSAARGPALAVRTDADRRAGPPGPRAPLRGRSRAAQRIPASSRRGDDQQGGRAGRVVPLAVRRPSF